MFGPWLEVYAWLKTLRPDFKGFRRPHVNFITLHYIYMLSLIIIGSIVLYGNGSALAYIDALFFASGAATQSGLNTVNVNQLFLYQQIAMYFIACIANPIFINTFVVFVRLYWFEKRFQNIVLEAQRFRRTRSKGRTMSQSKDSADFILEERGVGDRKILVMRPGSDMIDLATHLVRKSEHRDGSEPNGNIGGVPTSKDSNEGSSSGGDAEGSSSNTSRQPLPFRREVTFVDELKNPPNPDMDEERMPVQRSAEQHIAFLENQRNPKDKGVLYIPGPRDFDRGYVPQQLIADNAASDLIERKNIDHQNPRTPTRGRYSETDDDDNQSNINERPLRNRITNKLSFEDASKVVSKTIGWRNKANRTRGPRGNDDHENKAPSQLQARSRTFASFLSSSKDDDDPMPYLSYQPTVGRNSAFVNLNESQREELGGIEYRALKTLVIILCTYFFGFHLLGVVCLLPWFVTSGTYGPLAERDGFSRVWWGIFTPASMFNDLGFTLNVDSMVSFQRAVFPLLFGSFLIIIGNTGFPCMLRLVIWILAKIVPRGSSIWEELRFLLDHPRRCFTLLFPSKATWWLFWILVILNSVDLLFFIILDLHDDTVTSLPPGIRVLCGWFQAASTRTAGFADVNLADLHPAIQVSYLVMMYISIFPIAISVRRTNVYEEKSLGIWGGDSEEEASNDQSYVGTHLRRQLSFDLWYVFLGLFIIAIVEGDRLQNTNEYAFTLFSVLFEVVSAYGTVGLSLGYPTIDASFSAEFRTISKLIIIAMQIRGRHRGLPYALDKAILLPSEGLQKKEEDEAQRRSRRNSMNRGSIASELSSDEPPPVTGNNERKGLRKHAKGGWSTLITQALSAGPALKKLMVD